MAIELKTIWEASNIHDGTLKITVNDYTRMNEGKTFLLWDSTYSRSSSQITVELSSSLTHWIWRRPVPQLRGEGANFTMTISKL